MSWLHRSERGVGFIELLISLVVVGILIAIAVPNLSGYRATSQMRAAAQQLVSDMRSAQQRAVAMNAVRTLVFVPASGAITGYEIRDGVTVEYSHTFPTEVDVQTTFPSRTITFTALGAVTDPGGSPTLCADNNAGLRIMVTITYATGRVTLAEDSGNC